MNVPGRGLSEDSLGNLVLYYRVYKPHCARRLSWGADGGGRERHLGHKATPLRAAGRGAAVMESPSGDKEVRVQHQTGKTARQTPRPGQHKGPAGPGWSPGAPPFVHALISHQNSAPNSFLWSNLGDKKAGLHLGKMTPLSSSLCGAASPELARNWRKWDTGDAITVSWGHGGPRDGNVTLETLIAKDTAAEGNGSFLRVETKGIWAE